MATTVTGHLSDADMAKLAVDKSKQVTTCVISTKT